MNLSALWEVAMISAPSLLTLTLRQFPAQVYMAHDASESVIMQSHKIQHCKSPQAVLSQ